MQFTSSSYLLDYVWSEELDSLNVIIAPIRSLTFMQTTPRQLQPSDKNPNQFSAISATRGKRF